MSDVFALPLLTFQGEFAEQGGDQTLQMVVCGIRRTAFPAFTKSISREGAENINKDDNIVNLHTL